MDCSNPGLHSARWWDALEAVSERFADTVKRQFGRLPKLRLGYSQSNAGLRFSSDMRSLLDESNAEQLTIMLDEIEYITPGIAGTSVRLTPSVRSVRRGNGASCSDCSAARI